MAWQRAKKTKPRPKKVSRLDILKDKLTGIIRDYRYEQIHKEYIKLCDDFILLSKSDYTPLSDYEAMGDYDKYDELLEEGFPEKFREALQISHKLSNQISHISDAISKEIDKADDIRYLSSLTKLSIKATKLNLNAIL
ncbi:MAG: hypothetical protein SPG65_05820 [Campylobacter sp.]|nr:hypothetical protein [Campylobacter sp.]